MSVAFPEVRVGDPVRHEALSVFPLFATTASPVEYLLADEGIGGGTITVEEVSQAGCSWAICGLFSEQEL
ncbi:MAG: DUF6569 family protein [Thermoguttaceae bacterium]|jgi:hypothetical protein